MVVVTVKVDGNNRFARAKSQFMSSKSPMLVTRFYIFSTVYT